MIFYGNITKRKFTFFTLFFLFSSTFCSAQQVGIILKNSLSWNEVKEQAKAQNKYIFVDCYASWCEPCRFMAENIFTLKEVGDYMNSKFISVSVQMDRTARDPQSVRDWYRDADELHKNYSVFAYPTFLFFDSDGNIVHRFEGSTGSKGQNFLGKVADVFVPEKRYYQIHKSDNELLLAHKEDSLYLRNFIDTALSKYAYQRAAVAMNYYLMVIRNPFALDNLNLIEKTIHFGQSKAAFDFVFKNRAKIKMITGDPEWIDYLINNRITEDRLKPLLSDEIGKPNWAVLSKELQNYYGEYGKRAIVDEKPTYYFERGLFFEYGKSTVEFMRAYSNTLNPFLTNSYCWQIFSSCNDRATLLAASEICKKSIEAEIVAGRPDGNNIDTFANLLYKSGDSTNAIVWETIALQFAINARNEKVTKSISDNLDKMKKGTKTWDH